MVVVKGVPAMVCKQCGEPFIEIDMLRRIPGGVFMMGSPKTEKGHYSNEEPRHEVHVPDFYMSRYLVTNQEYGLFLKGNPNMGAGWWI